MNVIEKLVEVSLHKPDDFLKIKETLTRIGIASPKQHTLYQSCHILHKRGHYYVVLFKEMFLLDGKEATLTEDDIGRRNTIISLLQDWGLLDVLDESKIAMPRASLSNIKILPFDQKKDWNLVAKYQIGRKS